MWKAEIGKHLKGKSHSCSLMTREQGIVNDGIRQLEQ